MLGDSALLVVLGIAVKDLTGSFSAAGLTYVGIVLPSLLAPLGGLLADRVRRRPFLVWICLLTGSAVLSLLFVKNADQVWLIYVVAVTYGLSYFLIDAALYGLMKVMLEDTTLASANGLLQTVRQGLRLVAPLVGAGIYSLSGLGAVAVFDAMTFAAAAVALLSIQVDEPCAAQAGSVRPTLADVAAGAMHLWRDHALRRVTAAVSISLLFIGFGSTTIYAVVNDGLDRPTAFIGVLAAFQGVGAVAGGLISPRVIAWMGESRTVGLGLLLFAAGQAGLVVPSVTVAAVSMIVGYCGLTWMGVGAATVLQRRTPAELMGRTTTAEAIANGLPQATSIAIGALLINFVDYRVLLLILGGAVAAVALVLLAMSDVGTSPGRRVDKTPEGGRRPQLTGVPERDLRS